ncbi:HNH endonuclease [Myxococcus sp. AB056]|uniref:HNH endonuclease n=1 Tax=Myxococcus sp. AB056 TaxID=2562792 RepID=UPI0018918A9A|nr:HNH endonuclease [Myxococcus sp. AB056]
MGHVYSLNRKEFIRWKFSLDTRPYISIQVDGQKRTLGNPTVVAKRSWAAADAERVEQAYTQHEEEIEKLIRTQAEIPETDREALAKARRGQGLFRENVARVEKACRITGVSILKFLIASHIKPWRCSSNEERLDGSNGLLLSPSIDFLFDRGFISFEDNGDLLVSREVDPDIMQRMGVEPTKTPNVGTFSPEQQNYLRFHRAKLFRSSQGR